VGPPSDDRDSEQRESKHERERSREGKLNGAPQDGSRLIETALPTDRDSSGQMELVMEPIACRAMRVMVRVVEKMTTAATPSVAPMTIVKPCSESALPMGTP